MTRCELFAGRNTDESSLQRTLDQIDEISVDKVIAESAGRIRRTTQIDIPDALIAATALEHDMPLMTRNVRHFERVAGLILRSPEDEPKTEDDSRPELSKPSRGSGDGSNDPLD